MKIALASDHAGFELKERIKEHLEGLGNDVFDCGCHSAERFDYPDSAKPASKMVADGRSDRAVLVCGSGIGMCMTANRFRGVRAAVLRSEDDASLSRAHNDANVACLGSRLTDTASAIHFVDLFFATPFDGGRHEGRVKKIDE